MQLNFWDLLQSDNLYHSDNANRHVYLKKLWHLYFKTPLDTLPNSWQSAYARLRTYFFNCQWFEVYDFVEFTAKAFPNNYDVERFVAACNKVLEQELSGYRFVDGQIAPITSKESIAAIEQAQSVGIRPVEAHLHQALSLFADRKKPDYRNSIKESISAVEAMCRDVSGNPKATLGEAIRALSSKVSIHPSLAAAFDKLYGYTSDAHGIRHALLEVAVLNQEDALFMLVSCSAFINYLVSKQGRVKAAP